MEREKEKKSAEPKRNKIKDHEFMIHSLIFCSNARNGVELMELRITRFSATTTTTTTVRYFLIGAIRSSRFTSTTMHCVDEESERIQTTTA